MHQEKSIPSSSQNKGIWENDIKSTESTYFQCDGSKVRKKTWVLFVLIFFSIQDAHVWSATPKAVGIDIPS